MEQDLTLAMKRLGFTANESRAYLALLRKHPATGYEMATASGVPRSAIYNVLRSLERQGLVNVVQEKPARYIPVPPDRLFSLLESRFARNLAEVRARIETLAQTQEEVPTWTVQGYEEMLDESRRLIGGARDVVMASLWQREAEALQDALLSALKKGAELVLFSFTPLPRGLGTQLSYGIAEAELETYWSHRLILIVDHEHVLMGGAENNAENRVVVSREEPLIDVARSNLVLDITLYGERTSTDTASAVQQLTAPLAPVEKLVANSLSDLEAASHTRALP